MRTAILAGLLTAVLIPLSLDQHPQTTMEIPLSHSALGSTVQASILAALSTARRNGEIERSLQISAKVREREFSERQNTQIDFSSAAIVYGRGSLVGAAQAMEHEARQARIEDLRTMAFVANRNAEINRSMVAQARARPLLFAAARNREIEISSAKVAAVRLAAFAAERNAEIATSMSAYDDQRSIRFAAARNREIAASNARVVHQQALAFIAARNAEIELSMARVKGESEFVAFARIAPFIIEAGHIETGSIASPSPALP